ncbi:hypothetical protein AFULGI_00016170 [Archaeoglobus fulgidus DSM 8774]|uniref:Uncharacterized protein n=2 Tax=Archaeoglobus fulgidus TaxID=2234 RepID=A0A075WH04_ARCFL|nr:hypothetical protein AFULGI_00016170 [Archaeoglobus fulgidus DSM 8774]
MSGRNYLKAIYIEIGDDRFLEVWQGSFVIGFKGPEEALKKIKETLSNVEILTSSTILGLTRGKPDNIDNSWIDRLFRSQNKEEVDLRKSLFNGTFEPRASE